MSAEKTTPRKLKCRFCDFKICMAYTKKDGSFFSPQKAFIKMERHTILFHFEEWQDLQNKLDRDYGERI